MTTQTSSNESNVNNGKEEKDTTGSLSLNKQHPKRNNKRFNKNNTLDSKNFIGETKDMNGQIFQTVEESKDATQYNKTVEALERYAFKNYTVDLSSLFQRDDPEKPQIDMPTKPTDAEVNANPTKKDIYELQLKEYIKEGKALKVALKSMWAVIWGQCSTSIRTKLEKRKNIKDLKKNADVVELLKLIQQACMNYEDRHHPCVTICQQFTFFHLFFQKEGVPIQKYLQIFRIMVENIERYGGEFGNCSGIIKYVLKRDGVMDKFSSLNEDAKKIYLKKARDQYLAIAFLLGGTRSKYSQLVAELQNSYILGEDKYPKDLEGAYDMMLDYSPLASTTTLSDKTTKDLYTTGISFYQNVGDDNEEINQTPLVPGVSGKVHKNVKCYACDNMGHYANDCPNHQDTKTQQHNTSQSGNNNKDKGGDGFSFTQIEYNLTQHEHSLNPLWVLLDTQSSCDIFRNSDLLENIKVEPGPGLRLHSNGSGLIETNLMGVVKGYGKVWYHPDSLANIMSFANVRKRFKVKISTGPNDKHPSITVTKSSGGLMHFKELKSGLYVYDASKDINKVIKDNITLNNPSFNYSLVSTINENESKFTTREVNAAKRALELYVRIGRPSYQTFIHILGHNLIRDNPVTLSDAKRAFDIYGKDIANIKGKTKRMRPDHVKNIKLFELPDYILKWHINVTLCIDILYVNQMPFLHTISRKLQFRTIEYMPSENQETILSCLQKVINIYRARGFVIEYICGDGQFECVRENVRPIHLNTSSAGEHVPEIERSIQTIKGDIRTMYHSLPYKKLPPLMIKGMVEHQVGMRNKFPSINGVSKTMSPLTIMTGLPIPTYHDFKLEFGQYVQVHDHPVKSNTMTPRTTPAIALGPSSSQNGWFFMSLETGKRLMRYKWTVVPAPMSVINRVQVLADEYKLKDKDTNQPLSISTESKDTIYKNSEHKQSECTNTDNQTNDEDSREDSDTEYSTSKSQSNFIADSISELTISQKSKKETKEEYFDIFEDSSLENITEFDSVASTNENNSFYDTTEYQNNETKNTKTETKPPYNDLREVDEDSSNQNFLNDQNEFHPEFEGFEYALKEYEDWSELSGEERSEHKHNDNPNYMSDTSESQNENTRSESPSINLQDEAVVENERSEDQPTGGENSEQEERNTATSRDNPYNLRKIRPKTSCGEFERTFYDYDYTMWQSETKKGPSFKKWYKIVFHANECQKGYKSIW